MGTQDIVAKIDQEATTAEEILDRMREIVGREQIVHGLYVGSDVNEDLAEAGTLCQGHSFCAIGTLCFAAGEPVYRTDTGGIRRYMVRGAHEGEREKIALERPEFALARAALNQVAEERILSGDYNYGCDTVGQGTNPDALEVFFENYRAYRGDRGRRYIDHVDLLGVIEEARERLDDLRERGDYGDGSVTVPYHHAIVNA